MSSSIPIRHEPRHRATDEKARLLALPVVARERAAHRAAVAAESARLDMPDRFPWGSLFVHIALVVGAFVVLVAVLGALTACEPGGSPSVPPRTAATCDEPQTWCG